MKRTSSVRNSRAGRWSRVGRWVGLIAAALLLGLFLLSALGALPIRVSASDIARAKCNEYRDDALFWARFHGTLPTRLEEMEVPLRPGEPTFIVVVDDPWGNPYELERDGDDVRVRSAGPDGQARNGDDITAP